MPDMQVAVRLRRQAGAGGREAPVLQVFCYGFVNKTGRFWGLVGQVKSFRKAGWCYYNSSWRKIKCFEWIGWSRGAIPCLPPIRSRLSGFIFFLSIEGVPASGSAASYPEFSARLSERKLPAIDIPEMAVIAAAMRKLLHLIDGVKKSVAF